MAVSAGLVQVRLRFTDGHTEDYPTTVPADTTRIPYKQRTFSLTDEIDEDGYVIATEDRD